jgi:hypothetical protein
MTALAKWQALLRLIDHEAAKLVGLSLGDDRRAFWALV